MNISHKFVVVPVLIVLGVVLFFGVSQNAHALSQGDIDIICIILDCSDDVRVTLEALVDDESLEITTSLWVGAVGDQVELLQEILATDSSIYPEGLVTGYYGPLTEKAVERFQERFGIDAVGIVGPITRGTINTLLNQEDDGSGKVPLGLLKKFDTSSDEVEIEDIDDDGDVDEDDGDDSGDNSDGDSDNDSDGDKKIIICHKGKNTLSVGAAALGGHMVHGDTQGACDVDDIDDDDGDDASDEVDDEAPEISNIEVSDITENSAVVSWETNEESDSAVSYYEESDNDKFVGQPDILFEESDDELVKDHSIELSDLNASTTYTFFVTSVNEEGNEAESDTDSFTTLNAEADSGGY